MIKNSGMVITQTPLRVSFVGGGTDYPEYFNEHGGATIGTSIDKYIYITVNPLTPLFDHKIRVSYSRTELCKSIDEIQHPAVREALRFIGIDEGIEINVISDLPARSGLGSSSSFTVGLLLALHALKGEMVSCEELAAEAIHVEREMIPERVGFQDQHLCAHGGFLYLSFSPRNRTEITPLVVPHDRMEELEANLMLFYTGIQRIAHDILKEQIERTKQGLLSEDLRQLHSLVDRARTTLSSSEPLSRFGELLHTGWQIKRRFATTVSNTLIDDAYEAAIAAGALGGKLLGAGAGGFLLLFVPRSKQDSVRIALSGLKEVEFRFENEGSRVIFYRPVSQ